MKNIDILRNNYESICERARRKALNCGRSPEEVKVIAVSKTQTADVIVDAISAGISIFGENYVQELNEKYKSLNEMNIRQPVWHFIGHLQTNKVKYIAPFINMIHTIDSLRLAEEINRCAGNSNRIIDALIQVNTSGEEQKSGCNPNDTIELVNVVNALPNLNIQGLMTIGSFSDDEELVRSEFRLLRSLFDTYNHQNEKSPLKHLSMGMTGDFELAIEEGATFVRVGTAIFGSR
jgi:hypothetical protein